MKKMMLVLGMFATLGTGCAYGGLATVGDKVVVARNDLFLFGALRKVYVCDVGDSGLKDCTQTEAP